MVISLCVLQPWETLGAARLARCGETHSDAFRLHGHVNEAVRNPTATRGSTPHAHAHARGHSGTSDKGERS
jgi:hypothetical protein